MVSIIHLLKEAAACRGDPRLAGSSQQLTSETLKHDPFLACDAIKRAHHTQTMQAQFTGFYQFRASRPLRGFPNMPKVVE